MNLNTFLFSYMIIVVNTNLNSKENISIFIILFILVFSNVFSSLFCDIFNKMGYNLNSLHNIILCKLFDL
jgi:hypothetical protein